MRQDAQAPTRAGRTGSSSSRSFGNNWMMRWLGKNVENLFNPLLRKQNGRLETFFCSKETVGERSSLRRTLESGQNCAATGIAKRRHHLFGEEGADDFMLFSESSISCGMPQRSGILVDPFVFTDESTFCPSMLHFSSEDCSRMKRWRIQ